MTVNKDHVMWAAAGAILATLGVIYVPVIRRNLGVARIDKAGTVTR